jgi:hypothetical protein
MQIDYIQWSKKRREAIDLVSKERMLLDVFAQEEKNKKCGDFYNKPASYWLRRAKAREYGFNVGFERVGDSMHKKFYTANVVDNFGNWIGTTSHQIEY